MLCWSGHKCGGFSLIFKGRQASLGNVCLQFPVEQSKEAAKEWVGGMGERWPKLVQDFCIFDICSPLPPSHHSFSHLWSKWGFRRKGILWNALAQTHSSGLCMPWFWGLALHSYFLKFEWSVHAKEISLITEQVYSLGGGLYLTADTLVQISGPSQS